MTFPSIALHFVFAAGLFATASACAAAETAENYMGNCAVCHLPGIAGAPKVGDKAEWTRRVRAGISTVYRNALQGIPNTAMTAKGGHDKLTDAEVKAIVDYMVGAAAIDENVLRAAARYDRLGITDRGFIALDADYDGYLTRNELAGDAVLLRNLQRFDRNRDGRLTETEYREAEATLERERAAVDVPDEKLIAAVRAALEKIPGIDLRNTKVEAQRGVLAMIGIVESAEVANRAYAAVKRVDGIKKIDNRLVSAHQMAFD
jgi:cytochrome c5